MTNLGKPPPGAEPGQVPIATSVRTATRQPHARGDTLASEMSSASIENGDGELDCPWCGRNVPFGLRVCQGCQSDIVYAATKRELTTAIKGGFVFGFVGALGIGELVGGYPSMAAAVYASLAIMLSITVGFAVIVYARRKGKPRFIRRTAL